MRIPSFLPDDALSPSLLFAFRSGSYSIDLYIPKKCSATNRLITAKDHAAVQINIGHVDASGHYNQEFTTFALAGFLRKQVRRICSFLSVDCVVVFCCLCWPFMSSSVLFSSFSLPTGSCR